MILIVYFMAGLTTTAGAFFTLVLICILVALAGEGMSQAISVFAGDEQTAAAIVPVAVIFQVLFAGFFIAPNALPGYIAWARWLTFLYYAFNAAVRNEFNGRGDGDSDQQIIDALESDLSVWTNIAILAGFLVTLKGLYFLALTATKPRFDRKL